MKFEDGDKANLYYKNLELVTKSELARKAAALSNNFQKVICTEKDSGIQHGPYDGVRHASRELGINRQSISDNLNGRSNLVARKYIFIYAN